MRDVTIQYGACDVFVEGIAKPCPLCHTLVCSGEFHRCRLRTTLDAVGTTVGTTGGKATVEGLRPHKGSK
jgi:hypothetical protein